MKNTINLDQIIRKQNSQAQLIAGEEVLVTIDLTSRRAIEKTLRARFAGNFQDYLVANNRNPTRSGGGKLVTYYVCDAQNERTLALDISVTVSCPAGNEVKVAEALHGEQNPSQIFAALLERLVREFIPRGDEGRFIATYETARQHLEKHLARRVYDRTGLELLPKIALSAEKSVPREIVVGPIEVGVRLQDYKQEQSLTIEAGLALDEQDYVKAFVFQERQDSPEELFKRHLREYFFQQVTFQQFSRELQYPNFKQPLQQTLSAALGQVGRRVSFINFFTDQKNTIKGPSEFVAVTYNCSHNIHGRPQPVVIQNTVQLYCENSVAFMGSGVTDLEAWVKSTLNIILKRHLIGKTYVDLLLRFEPLEQNIKRELSARAALIGYKVDHLVSIPNLDEIVHLSNPFILEFDNIFETKLDNFEVQLKFSIKLRIPNLQTIEKYLNQSANVKDAIKETVLSETRQCLRNIHPERFYLYFNHPNEAATKESERLAVKDLLGRRIAESLTGEFGAEIFDLTTRVGRTDLTERYNNLCYVIREFHVSVAPPDPHGAESLSLTGNFEVRGVHSDSDGWQRFSAMRLDLDGLRDQLEKHLTSELRTYCQSDFMFQNRLGRRQVFTLVENYASQYMRSEFGLIVHLTNLDRNMTGIEQRERQRLIELESQEMEAAIEQGQCLLKNLKELKKRRANVLSVYPLDAAELQEIDETIKLVQAELDSISSARFASHRLAATLENQRPDALPEAGHAPHAAVQYELGPKLKGQLAD